LLTKINKKKYIDKCFWLLKLIFLMRCFIIQVWYFKLKGTLRMYFIVQWFLRFNPVRHFWEINFILRKGMFRFVDFLGRWRQLFLIFHGFKTNRNLCNMYFVYSLFLILRLVVLYFDITYRYSCAFVGRRCTTGTKFKAMPLNLQALKNLLNLKY
jgi:hypothetical protein